MTLSFTTHKLTYLPLRGWQGIHDDAKFSPSDSEGSLTFIYHPETSNPSAIISHVKFINEDHCPGVILFANMNLSANQVVLSPDPDDEKRPKCKERSCRIRVANNSKQNVQIITSTWPGIYDERTLDEVHVNGHQAKLDPLQEYRGYLACLPDYKTHSEFEVINDDAPSELLQLLTVRNKPCFVYCTSERDNAVSLRIAATGYHQTRTLRKDEAGLKKAHDLPYLVALWLIESWYQELSQETLRSLEALSKIGKTDKDELRKQIDQKVRKREMTRFEIGLNKQIEEDLQKDPKGSRQEIEQALRREHEPQIHARIEALIEDDFRKQWVAKVEETLLKQGRNSAILVEYKRLADKIIDAIVKCQDEALADGIYEGFWKWRGGPINTLAGRRAKEFLGVSIMIGYLAQVDVSRRGTAHCRMALSIESFDEIASFDYNAGIYNDLTIGKWPAREIIYELVRSADRRVAFYARVVVLSLLTMAVSDSELEGAVGAWLMELLRTCNGSSGKKGRITRQHVKNCMRSIEFDSTFGVLKSNRKLISFFTIIRGLL